MRFSAFRLYLAQLLPVILIAATAHADKASIDEAVQKRSGAAWDMALQLWEWAEPGYQETKSSALLAGKLEKAGFEVTRGVADIPTAFVAEFGSGKPVIGILGEFDALPGLRQEAVPHRQRGEGSDWGHACGHHLFGSASVLATLALADEIKAGELSATIRFYGTPAEEGGAAKVFMTREGLFDDVDAVLHWHPGDRNSAGDPTNLARIAAKFRFYGRSAHAAGAPEQGRSALDAVELMNYATQLMREHTPDFSRIHHVITAGGKAPNVVPDFAEVYYYVRHPEATIVKDLYRRLILCAEAGALATETEVEIENLAGTHNMLPNDTLSEVTYRNLVELADLSLTDEEREFAVEMQKHLEQPRDLALLNEVVNRQGEISKGSTDVGDVSWVAPTTGFSTTCWVPGTPAHSWQAVAAGGTTIGKKGMILAARVLAATAWDLIHSPEVLERAQEELQERLAGDPYEAMLEPGQAPPLNYRNAPEQ